MLPVAVPRSFQLTSVDVDIRGDANPSLQAQFTLDDDQTWSFLDRWVPWTPVQASTELVSSFLADRTAALEAICTSDSLPDNWDGYGGAAVLKETATLAAGFLLSLPTHVPAPEVSTNPNGTLSLEWENEFGKAHLEIGKTTYSLYFRNFDRLWCRDAMVDEIDGSKGLLLNGMFSLALAQDYVSDIVRIEDTP